MCTTMSLPGQQDYEINYDFQSTRPSRNQEARKKASVFFGGNKKFGVGYTEVSVEHALSSNEKSSLDQ